MGLFFDKKIGKKELLFFLNYGLVVLLCGIFLSTFDIIVHINFFNYFGYKYLASAYILSGLFGMLLTFLYAELYKRISIKLFFFLVITFLVLLSSIFYIWHFVGKYGFAYYFGMVLLFPLNTLMLLILWRFGRKIFHPSKTRSLFPIIKYSLLSGLAIGAATFAIGLFYARLNILETLSFIILLLLWPAHLVLLFSLNRTGIGQKDTEKYIPGKRNYFLMLNSKFTSYLLFFVLLSAIASYTINFAFVNIAWVAFKTDIGMAKFYGLFIAVMSVFILSMDRFLIKRILYSYDSPYSIFLIPILLFLAVVGILGVNFFVVSAQTIVDNFSVFFLFLAILKVAYSSMSFTIQSPGLRTLYQILDIRYRQVVYPRIEGTLLMAGLSVAGIIILALTYLKFYSLTIILLFVVVVSICWVFVAVKLMRLYSNALRMLLSQMRLKKSAIQENKRFDELLGNFFSNQDSDKIITAMNISRIFQPMVFEHDLIRLLAHPSSDVHSYVLDNLISESVSEALPILKERYKQSQGVLEQQYKHIIDIFEERKKVRITESDIDTKLYDSDDKVRENLVTGIENTDKLEISNALISLLKDTSIQIRNRAIKSMAKAKQSNFNYSLIEFLYPNNYSPYAFEAIAVSQDSALEYLEREALLPATDNLVLSRILRLYGKIGTEKAINNLISNLDNNDSFIMNQSIEILYDIRFHATNEEKLKIQGYFVKRISILAFTLKIYQSLLKRKNCHMLAQAYLYESERNIELLFKLLSLIYNPNIIFSLRKLFNEGSRAEISHAVELMDEHIKSDIKPLFQILIEDISLDEKVKRLDYYFPQHKYSFREIISLSLTYDFNTLSIYTRSCALVLIDFFKLEGFEDEIKFCSEHPNKLLSEIAHFIMNRSNGKTNSKNKNHRLEQFIESEEYKFLLFYKFYKIKMFNIMNQLNEDILIKLVESAKIYLVNNTEKLFIKDLDDVSLLITDQLVVNDETQITMEFGSGFISLELLKRKKIDYLMLKESGIIWGFDKSTVENLMMDNIEFANTLLVSLENFKLVENGKQDS